MMGKLIDEADVMKLLTEVELNDGTFTVAKSKLRDLKPAYDTEQVIEQLNDLPTFKVSATSEKHPFCAYEAEMISKHKVMGIVKKGGAE